MLIGTIVLRDSLARAVRALLNYVYPKPVGRVMDNFAGCGTLLVEATWLGLDSTGKEINPLSTLRCNVKCTSLTIPPDELKKGIDGYLQDLRGSLDQETQSSSSALSIPPDYHEDTVKERKTSLPARFTSPS